MGNDGLEGALNCGSIWGMLASDSFSDANAIANAKNVLSDWLSSINSPALGNILKAHKCRSAAYIPFPFSSGPSDSWLWTNFGIDKNSGYSLSQKVISDSATNIGESMNQFLLEYISKIAWPGFVFSWMLFIFFLKKTHKPIEVFFVMILSCRQIILISISSSQEFRYAFLLYIFGYIYTLSIIPQLFLSLKIRFQQFVLLYFHHQKGP